MDLDDTIVNKRAMDRRQFSWRTVLFGFIRSRRRDTRRDEEPEQVFTDWHHPWLFAMAIGTMLLSCVDAFMTLQLLQRGMFEANPVMASALNIDVRLFVISKMGLTALGVLTLVYLAKIRFLNRFRTGLFLTMAFTAYCGLVCYELVQFFKVI